MEQSAEEKIDVPTRVVGIAGSLRPGSYTRLAVQLALRGAAAVGAETRLLDLADYDLVFCTGDKRAESYPEGVARLRGDVQAAHGIILGTPEYHGSFSGVLKNALDLMGFDEFEGKMIGLIGVSGGRMGAIRGLDSLRSVGRALHAWVVPEEASIPQVSRAFDESGALRDADLERRVMEVGRQVARFAYLHTCERMTEFLKKWEEAPPNPGG